MPVRSREIRLKSRPKGTPTPENFELAETELGEPGAGEVQVRNLWMSVDPYMRGRMIDRPSYVPPFQLGEPLQGGAVGVVEKSNAENFAPGDLVQSMLGWREAFNLPAKGVQKLDPHGLPPELFLGVAGMPGMTAWVGLLKVGKLMEGETVFVSAGAGAVGSVVVQIAKLWGCTVVASAGGADKLAYLREIGADQVIDYRAEADLAAALARAAPKGVDLYFDNVGGDHLQAALGALRPFGRAAICGMISQYNDAAPVPGPTNLALVIGKRLRVEGFIVSDHVGDTPAFVQQMAGWISSGEVKWRATVDHGIEAAPNAFMKLFSGENIGKMLVKLS